MSRNKRSYAQQLCVKTVGMTMHRTKMIWPGCKIGIALSGGVDSFVLTKTLKIRQGILPFRIDIIALHINPGFAPKDHAGLLPWLSREGIACHIETGDFGPKAEREGDGAPCFRCAWLRRKRLFELCGQYHLTHLAFGHNADDLTETFFMNICRNGRVQGMSMCEPFFGGKLMVVRPLLLLGKKYIRQAARQWDLPFFENSCPWSGHTARSDMSETLKSLYAVSRQSRRCIENAICRWQLGENEQDNKLD